MSNHDQQIRRTFRQAGTGVTLVSHMQIIVDKLGTTFSFILMDSDHICEETG